MTIHYWITAGRALTGLKSAYNDILCCFWEIIANQNLFRIQSYLNRIPSESEFKCILKFNLTTAYRSWKVKSKADCRSKIKKTLDLIVQFWRSCDDIWCSLKTSLLITLSLNSKQSFRNTFGSVFKRSLKSGHEHFKGQIGIFKYCDILFNQIVI